MKYSRAFCVIRIRFAWAPRQICVPVDPQRASHGKRGVIRLVACEYSRGCRGGGIDVMGLLGMQGRLGSRDGAWGGIGCGETQISYGDAVRHLRAEGTWL
jgi:hypothetical protein